ncbi:hypothetical protein AB2M62_03520 [Sphingomonas sp. MMS12-HWE2-04]|uniref:hypothetical protein n=1 Tax=Sphingomonas sp. MMS12-HWE2-04 TaxID=3234199 RepID=UPI003850E61E
MAFQLGISPNTVNGYLREAMQILGTTSRRHAARLLTDHEHPTPQTLRGEIQRVEDTSAEQAPMTSQFEESLCLVSSAGSAVAETSKLVLPSPNAPNLAHADGGTRRPGDLSPGRRLVLVIAGSLVLGAAVLISILAAVGLVAATGYLRP